MPSGPASCARDRSGRRTSRTANGSTRCSTRCCRRTPPSRRESLGVPVTEHWQDEPEEHDFPAAADYLSLVAPAERGREGRRRAPLGRDRATARPRTCCARAASRCSRADNVHVKKDLAKVAARQAPVAGAARPRPRRQGHTAHGRRRLPPDLREPPHRRGRRRPVPARRLAVTADRSTARHRQIRRRASSRRRKSASSRRSPTSTTRSQEWRRLFSELYGTFFLVLVAAGGGMMSQAFPGTITRTAAVVAPGLMVMAIIMFMGKVSGAHLNPAVSIAFSLRGDFPWRRVPGYVIVQLLGATLAPSSCGRSSTSRRSTAGTTRRAGTRTGERSRWRRCSPSAW